MREVDIDSIPLDRLASLLGGARAARLSEYALRARSLVLDGTPDFFELTKRIHNHLHGSSGDAGRLGDEQRAIYEHVLADNLANLRRMVRAGSGHGGSCAGRRSRCWWPVTC